MKKLYASFLALAAVLSVGAQQLPNVGFEDEWVDCKPWNSVYDNLTMVEAAARMGQTVFGLQPTGWIVSDVLGIVSPVDEEDGGGYGALGTTNIALKVEGYNSESALNLKNNPNPFMASQIVPGYVSLGKTWATNTLDWATFQPADKDGGTFGGLDYTGRPDAISFYYTRAHGGDDLEYTAPDEKATVVVYSWKGSWSQADVPGNNTMSAAQIVKVTMVDRDRNILGMETAQGGEVTASEDAELISKLIYYIEGDAAEWTLFEQPIEYLSDATPEKINVVIAANEYFNPAEVGNGNEITLDDVRLVYYSRLSAISLDGEEIEGFDSKTYTYDLSDVEMPESEAAISADLLKNVSNATATTVLNKANSTATITVKNENGTDYDGLDTHVYTLKFKEAEGAEGDEYEGTIHIGLAAIGLGEDVDVPGSVFIIPDETDETKCTFKLPNFSLGEGADFGDIVVPDVTKTPTEDGYSYYGVVESLELQGGLTAKVTVTGTTTNAGVAHMDISVVWMGIPIAVEFNGTLKTGSVLDMIDNSNAPVEYYNINGMRVAEDHMLPGLYIRRQGTEVKKVIVK